MVLMLVGGHGKSTVLACRVQGDQDQRETPDGTDVLSRNSLARSKTIPTSDFFTLGLIGMVQLAGNPARYRARLQERC
jgi:hypothetical protein